MCLNRWPWGKHPQQLKKYYFDQQLKIDLKNQHLLKFRNHYKSNEKDFEGHLQWKNSQNL